MTSLNAQRYRVLMAGICSLLLTIGIARFTYTPLLPIMKAQVGLSYLAGGWLATFNYMGYMSGALLAASISQLSNKFYIYRVGLVVAVLSTIAMGLTDNLVLWAILRYIGGLTSVCGMLIASGLIMNWLMRNQFKPLLGLHFAGLGLSISFSGLAVGLMASSLQWNELWIAMGILGIALLIPAYLWMPAPADVPVASSAESVQQVPSKKWMNILIAAYFCGGFGFVVSATFIVAILEKLPELSGVGSWIWVLIGLAAAPSTFLWDKVAIRIGQIEALMLAYGLQVISVILPVLTTDVSLNVISGILYGNTFVGIVSLALSLVGRSFPNNPAKAMAKLTLSYGLAQIIAPAMSGYIANATGSYNGALEITAVVLAIGVVLLMMLKQLKPITN